MRRRAWIGLMGALVARCAPTPEQQAAALTPTASPTDVRMRQSRRFDTSDRSLMMQSAIGALQDLGYTIEETNAPIGLIVGSRLGGAHIRAQISIHVLPNGAGTVVRATFQRIVYRGGATPAVGDAIEDAAVYRGFFERIAQSSFLTAHEI